MYLRPKKATLAPAIGVEWRYGGAEQEGEGQWRGQAGTTRGRRGGGRRSEPRRERKDETFPSGDRGRHGDGGDADRREDRRGLAPLRCLSPLKPPVFKCDEAHIVMCSGCRCGHHGQLCGRAAVYTHCAELDAIVATAKVPCAYAPYGCHSYIVYAAVTDHQRTCPCAPCSCPEPGCCFRNSPATLLGHFAAEHSWPVTEISYGKPCKLGVPLPPPGGRSHVLVGDADRALFLVSSCAVGAGTAVCVVCVRANGDATPAAAQYKCKLWVEVSTNDDNMAMMTSMVRSSDLSGGFPAADKGMLLWVPPDLLHDVSGEMAILNIRIDRAGAATAKFTTTTTRARSQRGMH